LLLVLVALQLPRVLIHLLQAKLLLLVVVMVELQVDQAVLVAHLQVLGLLAKEMLAVQAVHLQMTVTANHILAVVALVLLVEMLLAVALLKPLVVMEELA
jgi:hypothetical protein